MIIFLLTLIVCLLVYFILRVDEVKRSQKTYEKVPKSLHNSKSPNYYFERITRNQQILGSYLILAEQFKCLPDKVKEKFDLDLSDPKFSDDDRFTLLAAFRVKKYEEATYYGIPAECTPTGILEQWTYEYMFNNFIPK